MSLLIELLLKSIGYILSILPRKWAEWLLALLGMVLWDVFKLRRKIVLKNLDIFFAYCRKHHGLAEAYLPEKWRRLDDQSREAIGRESTISLVFTFFENMVEWARPGSAKVVFKKFPEVNEGMFLLCVHMANWEILGASFSKKKLIMKVVVKEAGVESLTKVLRKFRKDIGFLAIEKKKDVAAVREILRTLDQKSIIGFVLDQFRPGDHIVNLFDLPTRTNSTLARLHRQTLKPIRPLYNERQSFLNFHAEILDPLPIMDKTTETDADISAYSLSLNHAIEVMIMRNPGQYFWQHRRFKD